MAYPFDVRALVGRTFGGVLDEITPWDGQIGFTRTGPVTVGAWYAVRAIPTPEERSKAATALSHQLTEIRRKLDPIVAALGEGTVVALVDIAGTVVPRWVWLSGRWRFYRYDEHRECLKALTASGEKVEYFSPRFAAAEQPAAANKKPAYGETPQALRNAMATYKKELSGIKTQDKRAAFLAQKVRCSKSSAINFLKDEGK